MIKLSKGEFIIRQVPVLVPSSKPRPSISLAPRLKTIKGKSIAIYDNQMNLTKYVIPPIEQFLKEQGVKKISIKQSAVTKDLSYLGECTPEVCGIYSAEPEDLYRELTSFDAVISTIANCGSCTSRIAVFNTDLEKRGVPTVALSTFRFARETQATAMGLGFPYLPVVVIHFSRERPSLVEEATEKILPEIVHALITPVEVVQKEYNKKWL